MFIRTARDWNLLAKGVMCLSVILIVLGAVFAIRTMSFLHRASRVQGSIVKLVERSGNNGTTYAPVFTFTDTQGATHRVYSSWSSYPPIGEVGDRINVLYDPAAPATAVIDRFLCLWSISIALAGIGLFYLCVFAAVAVFTKRRMTSAAVSPPIAPS